MDQGEVELMTTSRCYFHGAEDIPIDAWRVCFECGHVWETRQDCIAAIEKDLVRWGEDPEAAKPYYLAREEAPYSCPECAHDF